MYSQSLDVTARRHLGLPHIVLHDTLYLILQHFIDQLLQSLLAELKLSLRRQLSLISELLSHVVGVQRVGLDLYVPEAVADMPVLHIDEHAGPKMDVDVLVDLCVAIAAALEVAEEAHHRLVVVLAAVLALARQSCQGTQVLGQLQEVKAVDLLYLLRQDLCGAVDFEEEFVDLLFLFFFANLFNGQPCIQDSVDFVLNQPYPLILARVVHSLWDCKGLPEPLEHTDLCPNDRQYIRIVELGEAVKVKEDGQHNAIIK